MSFLLLQLSQADKLPLISGVLPVLSKSGPKNPAITRCYYHHRFLHIRGYAVRTKIYAPIDRQVLSGIVKLAFGLAAMFALRILLYV